MEFREPLFGLEIFQKRTYNLDDVLHILKCSSSNSSGLASTNETVSATAADVETTLSLPASPRLIPVSSATRQVTIKGWMITFKGSEGITPTFAIGLAAMFATYYIFSLQYQDETACPLEFIQRHFIDINQERGTNAKIIRQDCL